MRCNSGAGPLPVVELPLCEQCGDPLEFPRPEENVCFLCLGREVQADEGANTPTPDPATADEEGQYVFAL